MHFIDQTLARRLESTDAYSGVEFARAHVRLNEGSRATAEAFAGGWAIFAGVDSPLTQAFALGLDGPVDEDEIERMEDFFHSRGVAADVELCPYADPSIVQIFKARSYTLLEFSNVLARKLSPEDARTDSSSEVLVRRSEPHEIRLLAETVGRGFFETGDLPPSMIDMFDAFFQSSVGVAFLAEVDGTVAGGGVVIMHEGIASLGGASTLPAFRNRGIQTALLRARLAFATRAGCEIAMVTTMPGTISQRNVERRGFRVVYTRTKIQKQRSEVRDQ
ncbi:MAG: GNAT family N-acetyltransferase [Blastocatellia bacterium]